MTKKAPYKKMIKKIRQTEGHHSLTATVMMRLKGSKEISYLIDTDKL